MTWVRPSGVGRGGGVVRSQMLDQMSFHCWDWWEIQTELRRCPCLTAPEKSPHWLLQRLDQTNFHCWDLWKIQTELRRRPRLDVSEKSLHWLLQMLDQMSFHCCDLWKIQTELCRCTRMIATKRPPDPLRPRPPLGNLSSDSLREVGGTESGGRSENSDQGPKPPTPTTTSSRRTFVPECLVDLTR